MPLFDDCVIVSIGVLVAVKVRHWRVHCNRVDTLYTYRQKGSGYSHGKILDVYILPYISFHIFLLKSLNPYNMLSKKVIVTTLARLVSK